MYAYSAIFGPGETSMTLRRVAALVLFAVMACSKGGASGDSRSVSNATSIVGTWELIEFESTRGSVTTRLIADPEPLALTVYTPDHFAYVWQGQATAGAGTYRV
jgi:hypothetical protein